MKKSDEQLIQETQRDILAETEKILGKRHEDFNKEEREFSLLSFMLENKMKSDKLAAAGDTHFHMTWNEFVALILKNGFKLQDAWSYDKEEKKAQLNFFTSPEQILKTGNEPYDVLAMFERDGMLIVATSFGDHVNGGNLYYERELKQGIDYLYDIKSLSSYGLFAKNKLQGHYDIREGLMVHIRELEEKTNAIPIWEVSDPHPWVFSYVDEKIISENDNSYKLYDKVRKERLSASSETIKNMCSVQTGDSIVLKSGTYKNNGIRIVDLSKVKISKIEENVFEDCPNLQKIIIDSNVKIPSNMIKNCPNLISLIVHGVEIPLNHGNIIDNSLTGIDEIISREKMYKNEDYIDDISFIKSRLEILYRQAIKENKLDLLEALTAVKESADDEHGYLTMRLDNIEYNKSYFGGEFKKTIKDTHESESLTTKEFIDIIDNMISDVINGKIKKITILSNITGDMEWETESKQAKMIREDIEKIEQEISDITTENIPAIQSHTEEIR